MKLLVFAVRDMKAETFGNPIIQRTRQEALRAFGAEASREGSLVHQFPGDFSLYLIGEYDPENGLVEPVTHSLLGHASDFRQDTQQLQLATEDNA